MAFFNEPGDLMTFPLLTGLLELLMIVIAVWTLIIGGGLFAGWLIGWLLGAPV
jgi:hypothetical protein